MVHVNNTTLILIVSIVIGIILIKLLGKMAHRMVGILVLGIFLLVYTYFFTDFFVEHKDNKIVQAIEKKVAFVSIIEYQKKHCNRGLQTRNDSITCECIIAPLVKDMKERLSDEEIKALETNKQLSLKELLTSLKRNQKEIQFNLKERNAIYLWNKMVQNLKQGKMIGEE